MNELSERARELAKVAIYAADFEEESELYVRVLAAAEQALLAEQQLAIEQCAVDCKYETGWSRGYKAAMEEAIAIADNEGLSEEVGPGDEAYNTAIIHVCKALRAAAEKEGK